MRRLRRCPLCGHGKGLEAVHGERAVVNLGGRVFEREVCQVICRACGLVFNNPMFEDRDVRRLYPRLNRRIQEEPLPVTPRASVSECRSFRLIRGAIHRSMKGWRILEIGCSYGSFLQQFLPYGGRCYGVDPAGTDAAHAARIPGMEVRTEAFDPRHFPAGFFDLVVLRFVLEHVPDPEFLLKGITRILRPGGYLWIEVPDVRRPFVALVNWFTPGHTFSFSRNTLRGFLGANGFKLVRGGRHAIWDGGLALNAIWALAAGERQRMSPNINRREYARSRSVLHAWAHRRNRLIACQRLRLRSILDDGRRRQESVVLYGAGDHTAALFGLGIIDRRRIAKIVDGNPALQGHRYFGIRVGTPAELKRTHPDRIVVSAPSAEKEIVQRLKSEGFEESRLVTFYS